MPATLRCLALAPLAAAALACTGCNIIGPVAAIASGPPTQPAMFALDRDRPTVVFVDDRASVLPRRTLRQSIAQTVQNELLGHNALKTVIDSKSIAALAARDAADQPSDITTLGKAVSAEVVIYVSLDRFGVSPDGQVNQPFADARVKVLDITRPEPRLWPEDREGYAIGLVMPQKRADLPKTASGIAALQEDTARVLGEHIAQVFYKHETTVRPSRERD
jgi:hypothetical protein